MAMTITIGRVCRWTGKLFGADRAGRHHDPHPQTARRSAGPTLSDTTIAYSDRVAEAFWEGTRYHDVSQNCGAFLDAIQDDPPYSILDLGCGAGRDLSYFQSLGHEAVGLDGSQQFVKHGALAFSRCEVLHQDFLAMRLPEGRFDGIFANASLFHVPSQELPRVLLELCRSLKPRGVLFLLKPERE
jgi:SAM-dependent methyltransferase